jgi:hypothetical protein
MLWPVTGSNKWHSYLSFFFFSIIIFIFYFFILFFFKMINLDNSVNCEIDVMKSREDTKGVVRSCKSRKCQQYNEIERNNDLQTTTRKTKDLLARTPTKP